MPAEQHEIHTILCKPTPFGPPWTTQVEIFPGPSQQSAIMWTAPDRDRTSHLQEMEKEISFVDPVSDKFYVIDLINFGLNYFNNYWHLIFKSYIS